MHKIAQLPTAQPATRVFEEIVQYFKTLTAEHKLTVGDRLLSERDLARQLNVSRASLREALRALEVLGFLSIVPGKGTTILPPDPRALKAFFELASDLRPAMSENILEVRIGIECEAARLASKRANREELSYIKDSLERMAKLKPGIGLELRASNADFDFHKGIIRATHNDFVGFLYDALEVLLKQSHIKRWKASLERIPKAIEKLCRSHSLIYRAIAEGNELRAEERMREHFKIVD